MVRTMDIWKFVLVYILQGGVFPCIPHIEFELNNHSSFSPVQWEAEYFIIYMRKCNE